MDLCVQYSVFSFCVCEGGGGGGGSATLRANVRVSMAIMDKRR